MPPPQLYLLGSGKERETAASRGLLKFSSLLSYRFLTPDTLGLLDKQHATDIKRLKNFYFLNLQGRRTWLHLKGAGVKPDEAVELARLSKIVGNFKSHWKSLLVTGVVDEAYAKVHERMTARFHMQLYGTAIGTASAVGASNAEDEEREEDPELCGWNLPNSDSEEDVGDAADAESSDGSSSDGDEAGEKGDEEGDLMDEDSDGSGSTKKKKVVAKKKKAAKKTAAKNIKKIGKDDHGVPVQSLDTILDSAGNFAQLQLADHQYFRCMAQSYTNALDFLHWLVSSEDTVKGMFKGQGAKLVAYAKAVLDGRK